VALFGSRLLLLIAVADVMHGMLMRRPDALGFTEGSEAELEAIVAAIEAYEVKRWPLGKDPDVPGGKGQKSGHALLVPPA
jgi:hypothetical protein